MNRYIRITFILLYNEMDILWIVLWTVCMLLGIIGSFLPVLPGLILSYVGFILLQFTSAHPFSWAFFIVWAVIVIVVIVLWNIIPVLWTKKMGGTKLGVRGSAVGLIVGVVVLPFFGIVLWPFGLFAILGWPFLGAYIGEILANKSHGHALKAAFGSFIWFLAGSVMQLLVCVVMAVYYFVAVYHIMVR